MRTQNLWGKVAFSLAAAGFLSFGHVAQAGDYYSEVPYLATVKINPEGEGATPVGEVYGKEYSNTDFSLVTDPRLYNTSDHDAFGAFDPAQVVSWDGIPNPVTGNSGSVDGFDFEPALLQFNVDIPQIDALANRQDFLFNQIVRNEASLLFSMTADLGISGGTKSRVHFEDPDPVDLVADPLDIWALPQIPTGPGAGVNHHPVQDLDALEVWGPEPSSHENGDTTIREGYDGGSHTADANRFSLDNDSVTGTSVWAYDIATGTVGTWIPHSVIVEAVEDLFLGAGLDFDRQTRDMIDVDGTMARDVGDSSPTAPIYGLNDELLFTIDPIDQPMMMSATGGPVPAGFSIDGGEIMHLTFDASGAPVATFLKHGGHTWDTAFEVGKTFGYEFEDVDALEAVGVLEGDDISTPEPSTMVMIGLALAMVGFAWRRN
ncbi:PEP-CTERM sorting domain-containing protein [Aeoliella mucimassa]|uniref:PEP-CTERM motif protein n=1 Tax=Aeoliella mucimassa TaxID=2527972 RepID=A0A518AWM5_9BACT|nr:PEP-CTERM sorting domain-containing protein [Aeoliella mucimassa]QDU59137.1 PEP-CTERM motif protein [Aeoliella mucimassa]